MFCRYYRNKNLGRFKIKENPNLDKPEHLTKCAYYGIWFIYLEYCNERIPFYTKYLPYLQSANNKEIVRPFFEIFLQMVFDLKSKVEFPYKINYDYSRPKINNNQCSQIIFKRNSKVMDNQSEMNEWISLLEINDGTQTFKNYKEFWKMETNNN